MTTQQRQEWLTEGPARHPEMEQVLFGGNPPDVDDLPIEAVNPFNPHLFREDRWQPYFARLRAEDPVHFNELASAGRYWSITRYDDIKEIEGDWQTFTSTHGVTLTAPPECGSGDGIDQLPAFINLDPPEQTNQRKSVRGISAPSNLREIEALVRKRTEDLLDSLPEGETFDWVQTVSVELTTLMLATLFDFPMSDRRMLTRWSDVVFAIPEPGGLIETSQEKLDELTECVNYFTRLWDERRGGTGFDLVTMLANAEATRDKSVLEHLGNLLLLIIGGNDTTRNAMSASVYLMDRRPDQLGLLQSNPGLIDGLIPEVIRWQTPLAYMARAATCDVEFRGKQIKKHDQVLLWYVSANRDEAVFANPDQIDLRRPNADRHLSFGHGVHFCMGSRIAELQLRVLWESILPRFKRIEVQAEPTRTLSTMVRGYTSLPVQITRH